MKLIIFLLFGLITAQAYADQSTLVITNKLYGRDYMFFGSMCYSYPEDEPSSPDSFKCRRFRDTLYVDGLIEEVMYDEMVLWGQEQYRFPGQEALKTIDLNSKGGLMFDHSGVAATAVDMMKLIKERELETLAGAECKSACVPVFASGRKRLVRADTSFMVHSPRLGGSHVVFLKEKCGDLLDAPSCAEELSEIRQRQFLDMDRYFDLIEAEGVSPLLRADYLKSGVDPNAPGNGNLIGIADLYFDGLEALRYGLALGLRK